MGTIKRFEDIEGWKKSRILTKDIYSITKKRLFSKDYGLKDQIRKASVSIMLNIAEGHARRTDKEFSQFLTIAHGSSAEVQSALYVALDQEYINQKEFYELYNKVGEVSKILIGFINYLKR